jgi:DNA-binding response OmpR family regulator
MSKLLIVEDEAHIASGLRYNLEADGHDVTVKENGEAALAELEANSSRVDLVVLDVMLPGIDGFTVAARMRAKGWLTPILMLTARGRADDVLRGFEAGADDYLPKPFELSILIARINALLRRHSWHVAGRRPTHAAPRAETSDVFRFADKVVDFDAQELQVGAKTYPLTLMEANLLRYLVQHEGKAISEPARRHRHARNRSLYRAPPKIHREGTRAPPPRAHSQERRI